MRRLLLGLALLLGLPGLAATQTLEAVRARGSLICGVNGSLPGFSAPDAQGEMHGLDADFCRAVAAAVLGDAERVHFEAVPTPQAGLEALAAGRMDLLARNATVTARRDAGRGATPAGILFFDGQAVLVRRDLLAASFRDLDGRRICVAAPSVNQTRAVLLDAASRAGIRIETEEVEAGNAALFPPFLAGRCDGITADAGALAALRVTELPRPEEAVLLPELLSREPLGPWVRAGDEAWRRVVGWTLQALLAAEELGLESTGVEAAKASPSAEIRLLLGQEPGLGAALGLDEGWAAEALRQVGNYGEIFARNLGEASPIALDRGLNDLWRRGGLMYPLPFR